MRRLRVLVEHLPMESATVSAVAKLDGWTNRDFLLADVFHALTGKPHPARPEPETEARRLPQNIARALEQRQRQREGQP